MKLKNVLLTAMLATGTLAQAETENTNVNVQVNEGEGHVVIVKTVDGQSQTINETFTVDNPEDVQAQIDAILAQHGVDQEGAHKRHKVIELVNDGDNDFVFVKRSDDVSVDLTDGKATVVIKKDDNGEVQVIEETFDLADGADIDVLIDELMTEHGIEPGDAEVHKKIIKLDRKFTRIEDEKPRMGFMASAQEQGWEILSVVADSGAAEAGMQKGDLVISIDGQSTAKSGLGLTEFIAMDHQEGEVSEVTVKRNGQEMTFEVVSKVIDSPDIIMELDGDHKWFSSSGHDFKFNTGDLDGMFEGLHVDVEHLDKMVEGLGNHEIRVVTTGDADAYFFSGSKMNQWLGKNHHFSTVTESLGKYFGTSQGVLVLEVDKDNKLGLKDGDVIMSINDQDVLHPKDVVKIMSAFKKDQSFTIEIIREKETLYLES
jgi:membrane-associated protease RseP (regulator of RpoE activity)